MRMLRITASVLAVGASVTAGTAAGALLRGATQPAAVARAAPAPTLPQPPEHRFVFRRPFLVPVADGWRGQSIVVIELELQLAPADADGAGRVLETRLRDRILPALMTMGREGVLGAPSAALDEAVSAAAPVLRGGAPGVTVTSLRRQRA